MSRPRIADKGSIRNKILSQKPLSNSFDKVFFFDFKLYIFLKKRRYKSNKISALKLEVMPVK
jgi:hypothetical protein